MVPMRDKSIVINAFHEPGRDRFGRHGLHSITNINAQERAAVERVSTWRVVWPRIDLTGSQYSS